MRRGDFYRLAIYSQKMMKIYNTPVSQSIKILPVTRLLYDSNNVGGGDQFGEPDGAPARILYI